MKKFVLGLFVGLALLFAVPEKADAGFFARRNVVFVNRGFFVPTNRVLFTNTVFVNDFSPTFVAVDVFGNRFVSNRVFFNNFGFVRSNNVLFFSR